MSPPTRRRRRKPLHPWRVVRLRHPQPSGRTIEHLECGHMHVTHDDTVKPKRRRCSWCPVESA